MNVQPLPNVSPGIDTAATGQRKLAGKVAAFGLETNPKDAPPEVTDPIADDGADFNDLLTAMFGLSPPVVSREIVMVEAGDETNGIPTIENGKRKGDGVVIDILAAPFSAANGERLTAKAFVVPTSKNIYMQNAATREQPEVPEVPKIFDELDVPSSNQSPQPSKLDNNATNFLPQAVAVPAAMRNGFSPVNDVSNTGEPVAVESGRVEEQQPFPAAPPAQNQLTSEGHDDKASSVPHEEFPTLQNLAAMNRPTPESTAITQPPTINASVIKATTIKEHANTTAFDASAATFSSHVETARFDSTDNHVARIKENPIHIANIVTSAVLTSTARGESRVEVRLDPPELGSVWIELTSSEDGVSAKIISEQHRTSHLLQDNLSTLRRSLSESGISVTDFAFDTGARSSDRDRQAPESDWDQNRPRSETRKDSSRSVLTQRVGRPTPIGINVVV
jgi:hypothetical protein